MENLRAILPLAYATPSFLLSMALVGVLLRRYRTRFYTLYAFGLTVDWISSTFHYFSHRAYGAPLFYGFYATLPATGFLPSLVLVATRYFTYLQFEVCLALSFERLAAVIRVNHAKNVT
ncbi:hypothetical protein AAVH_26677 [Aphelenchoides avenae]|nr:hypothetical protein AAVH_26677 [Aphelenchus avenae]